MLLNGHRLVVLDCEVAWYGDPAFDLAFLISHLLLKALFHAPRRGTSTTRPGVRRVVSSIATLNSWRRGNVACSDLGAGVYAVASGSMGSRLSSTSIRRGKKSYDRLRFLRCSLAFERPTELCEQWFRHLETAIGPV